MESPTSTASRPDFYDFLDRMRRPAAADLFRSIKSFLVSFSFHAPNAEEDGSKVQAFLAEMESAIRDHPLWANATDQEIDHALEGLEKYVITKLFDRTFGTSTEDAVTDMDISEKIGLLQQFVKPHHLDIPKVLHNEASWLANPPQLHSNLKFIQLFRRETKLISEVEYYLTNLISAKMFIIDVSAHSLSMEESEFQKHMESARLATQVSVASPSSSQGLPTSARANQEETDMAGSRFPFMDSETESLTPGEVKQLHDLYKRVVTRYTLLSEALRKSSIDEDQLLNSVHDP
ncbi:Vacuolar protein sorting-associated protein 9A [Zea mays]|uniref:Vacuolar protein sorting-associated protein 9A n=1 Tax=Zea mays TaxID=4577 RepID=A0A1D6LBE3_MAIZE|nr:Vacuolar protein sorting-associated protein 9A [Zea mays]